MKTTLHQIVCRCFTQAKSLLKHLALPTITLMLVTAFRYPGKEKNYRAMEIHWTGTVTSIEKFTGITGHSERYIEASFTNALPTMYRDIDTEELNFTDDKGPGTVRFHGELIIEGKHLGTTDCQGSGGAELHAVVIDLEANTYDIEVISPACNGTNVSLLDGTTSPYGPEYQSITISQQPLGKNHQVLSGSLNIVADLDGDLGKVTRTITWYFTSQPVNAELIVTPEDYDNWMPEPGLDENSKGSVMNVGLKLQGKNGKPLQSKAKAFEIRLDNTSMEPGITINYPIVPASPSKPDLRFLPQANAQVDSSFQSMTINCSGCTTADCKIAAYDGGGYTTLHATAILEDDTRINGNLLVSGGTAEILIPKRSGSMIATKWLNANGNPGDYKDDEKSRDNNHPGDGLTAYEEYRGVISEGGFKRLDPKRKELGVAIEESLFQKFNEGLNWFQQASDIDIVRFYMNKEIGSDHRFNKNFLQGHVYDQNVLRIASVRMNGDIAGKAFTASGDPEIPVNTQVVAVSPDNIRRNYQNWSLYAQSIGQTLLWNESEYLAQTIAHEMGHGVKVSHHGDGSAPQGETAKQGSGPIYHIMDRNGAEINTRPYHIPTNDRVCPVPGSQASGDLGCLMAYVDVCDWARIEYADGSVGLLQSPLLPIGRKFCKTKDGTGINAGVHTVGGVTYENYFGKAINGICISQITLK